MASQRIEYIDAMRGFTMILVVYSHICRYCFGNWMMGWNDVFFLFRLPCFFFISGWLFEQVGRQWNSVSIRNTVKHKFIVQIVPTVIFLLLLAPPPLFFSKLGATKGGYWFTFALFEFFLLCIFSEKYLKRWSGVFALVISASAFFYDVYFNRYFSNLDVLTKALGFLSFMTWRYFLFFYIGTWVKRHFEVYLFWISKPAIIISVVIGFVLIALHPRSENTLLSYVIFVIGGVLGMTMIFAAFRYMSTRISSFFPLTYIGTRTLDIYLLHFFVLPRFLLLYVPQVRAYDSKSLEFIVAMALALVVVAICLLASYLIRLSPILAHYLFGVKYEPQK